MESNNKLRETDIKNRTCYYIDDILFGSDKYYFIYNSIRYLIGVKSIIKYVISHNYA